MVARLRGHAEARLDDKGRLKMPSVFKKSMEVAYGGALFITALTDDYLQVYPLKVWDEIEAKVNKLGAMHPLKRRFMTRANRCGAEVEMDAQGRVSLKPSQRQQVGIQGEVVIIGCSDHLEIWPVEKIVVSGESDAFSPEDFSTLGI